METAAEGLHFHKIDPVPPQKSIETAAERLQFHKSDSAWTIKIYKNRPLVPFGITFVPLESLLGSFWEPLGVL